MNILNKLTWRNMKGHRERTIVTIAGIALTSILIFGVGLLASTLRENNIAEVIRDRGNYHAGFASVLYRDKELIERAGLEEIYTLRFDKQVKKEFHNGSSVRFSRFDMYQSDSHYLENGEDIKGRLPVKEGELLVPASLLSNEFYQLSLGSTIELDGVNYQIVGSYGYLPVVPTNASNTFVVYTNHTFQADDRVTFYVRYDSMKGSLTRSIDVSRSLGEECRFSYYGTSCTNLTMNEELLELYGETNHFGALASMLLLILLVSFVIGAFSVLVIYNSFAISVTERKKMLGILSSVGATPRQLWRSVLFEALTVAVIGIGLGFVCSLGIFEAGILVVNAVLKTDYQLSVYPLFLGLSLLMIVLSVLFSSTSPALRAREITPLEAIRQMDDIRLKRKQVRSHRWIRKIFGIEGELAFKNSKRNKKKYRVSVLSLVISMVLFITFSTFVNLVFSTLPEIIKIKSYDIEVSINDPDREKVEHVLKDISDNSYVTEKLVMRSVTKYTLMIEDELLDPSYVADFKNPQGKYYQMFGSSPRKSLYFHFQFWDRENYDQLKRELHLQEDIPIVYNTLQFTSYDEKGNLIATVDTPCLKGGSNDVIPLCTTGSDEAGESVMVCDKTLEHFYAVNGSLHRYLEPSFLLNIVLPDEQFDAYVGNDDRERKYNVNSYRVLLSVSDWKGFEREFLKGRRAEDFGLETMHYTNYLAQYENAKRTLLIVRLALYAVIGFIAMIGITTVFNTIYTSVRLREKEFAVLKSVGMTPKGFRRMIRFESLFLGMKAVIYGIVLSIGLIFLIFRIINWGFHLENPNFHLPVLLPVRYIVIASGSVFVLLFLTMFFARRHAKEENVIDVLKKDSF